MNSPATAVAIGLEVLARRPCAPCPARTFCRARQFVVRSDRAARPGVDVPRATCVHLDADKLLQHFRTDRPAFNRTRL